MQRSERVTQMQSVQRPGGMHVSGMIRDGEQGGWQGMRDRGGGQKQPDSGYVIRRPNQGNY